MKEKADDVLLWKLLPKEDGCILQKRREKNEHHNQTVSKGVAVDVLVVVALRQLLLAEVDQEKSLIGVN